MLRAKRALAQLEAWHEPYNVNQDMVHIVYVRFTDAAVPCGE